MRVLTRLSKRWIIVLMGLALGVIPSASIAQDVTVWVGVDYRNLPEGAEPMVLCSASMQDPTSGELVILGVGSRSFTEPELSIDAVVDIELTELPGAYPDDVERVVCSLTLDGENFLAVKSFEECQQEEINPYERPLLCGPRGAQVDGTVSQEVHETSTGESEE